MSTFSKARYFCCTSWMVIISVVGWAIFAGPSAFAVIAVISMLSVLSIAVSQVCLCTVCGKSPFKREIWPHDTLVGKAVNPNAMTPEEFCSRCGADLWVQGHE